MIREALQATLFTIVMLIVILCAGFILFGLGFLVVTTLSPWLMLAYVPVALFGFIFAVVFTVDHLPFS